MLCGAAITWQLWSTNSSEHRLAEAARDCRARAEQGDAKAESQLAYMYSQGQGVPRDYDEALRWYHKSADLGYAGGEDGLGHVYLYGRGVLQDYAEALRWYRKAADQGDAKGQNELAIGYEVGEGMPRDYAEALRWYHKAVNQGYASAEYNLGNMYYYGRGVPQDSAEAVYWYQKAADQGNDYAQSVLHIKWKGMSTCKKISLSAMFLVCSWYLVGSLMPGGKFLEGQRRILTLAGLIGLSYVVFDLLGFRYIGILTPVSAIVAFKFVDSLMAGTFVALLLSVILPRKAWSMVLKVILWVFGILLIGIDTFIISISKMRHVVPPLRHCWPINAHLLGMMVGLAIALWLGSKRRIGTEPQCEVVASELPTEINGDGA